MKHLLNKNVLITTHNWFTAPDGSDYKAAWGVFKAVHTSQDTLGFTPSRGNTNWFVEVGNMVIAGCQVLYLIECPVEPNLSRALCYSIDPAKKPEDGGYNEFFRLSHIYNTNTEKP